MSTPQQTALNLGSAALDPELTIVLNSGQIPGAFTREQIPELRAGAGALFTAKEAIVNNPSLSHREEIIQGPRGDITLSIFQDSKVAQDPKPCFYYIHGGGMIVGNRFLNVSRALELATEFNAVCVSVEYRLAPEHPAPAGVEDCFQGLKWIKDNAASLEIDPNKIITIGQSGGGGLAAGMALLARDENGPRIKAQLLMCPMLDNRNELPSTTQCDRPPWTRANNEMAWNCILGDQDESTNFYTAPARAKDVSNLPPTFIDVGSGELFRDEVVMFASRLLQSGIMTELHVWAGVFHAADTMAPQARVSRATRSAVSSWIDRVLNVYD
ncbi:alpha beta hydrolase fold-3 [Fusarium circinatum]|uniref:Alpha beta hydrolase fold-3 n=1 Tax=Fusarium circinatum TaxID=48490 RepID=A0A8H5TH57_FUSCI|nr:alpha beta hydrolase fold-3 [Fusarium circinatum]